LNPYYLTFLAHKQEMNDSPDHIQDRPTGENSNETFELSRCFGYLPILLKLFFSFSVKRQFVTANAHAYYTLQAAENEEY